ncbi:DUF3016 domain-containing protein [Piscinibacter sp.]|jgi:hypothetical protein|uniref:DUF3016 domain-containing protein n=1 Tax=Piscinibacter sp. TaxID=1903157 RepID=UPI00355A7F72
MRPSARVLILGCFAAAAGMAQAGIVTVSFVDSARFADAGTTPSDEAANLRAISQHLQAMGKRYLAPDQLLKVEVRDVDLAGNVWPMRRRPGTNVRIVKGMADWPRINVRYTLESNGKVLKSGEESIADMDYLRRLSRYDTSEPLRHEKQMLDDWFRARFADIRPGTD